MKWWLWCLVISLRHPCSCVYLASLWLFAWLGGGGTKEPVKTQEVPETGREVGLMYSFSSESDDGFSPLDAPDAGRDLRESRQNETAAETWVRD